MHTSLRVTGVLSGVESSVVLGLGWRAVQRLHRLVETGVEIPGVAMVQLALQQTHFGHQLIAVLLGEAGGDLGVAGQQLLGVGDTVAHVAQHGFRLVKDRLLRQQSNGGVRR